MKKQADGKFVDTEFDWQNYGKGGPLGVWQGDNSNRLAVIVKWLEPYRINDGTPEGSGLATQWTTTKSDELIIYQDVLKVNEICGDANSTVSSGNFGTFIVNGGKCSSVIEFSPKYNFLAAYQNLPAGGGTSGPGSSANQNHQDAQIQGKEKECGAQTGMQQQLTITQQSWDSYGPKNAWKELMKSQRAHLLAGKMSGDIRGFEADLKILGDPRPIFCANVAGRSVSVVAINPFHLAGDGCGAWLAEPGCNPIMSNKKWIVMGINHSIQAGSYTTTLKLTLAQPGNDIFATEQLGGAGSGGPIVKNIN
jgi:hypothetical protein